MRHFLQLLIFGAAVIMFGCTKQSEKYISGLEMLKGGKVFAVPSGTAADQFVLKRFPDAKFEYYNTPIDCALAVQKGKADAAVYDKPVLLNIAAKNSDLAVIEEVIATDQYGYAVQKENAALKKVIDDVLAEIKANGTYDDMMKRWFPKKGNPAPMPDIKFDSTGGVLRLATSTGVEPMSFVNADRKIVGFDIEFASYIAQKLGKQLEVIDFEFGAMLPALIAGKVDMIGAGLSITAERAKQVLFSECYFPGGLSALVKKDVTKEKKDKNQKLSSLEDLKDKSIGVLLGSVQDMYVHKNFPDAEVRQYQNITDMLLALDGEKVDAIFLDETSFIEASSQYKDFGIIAKHLFDADIAAGFNQDSDELREKFNSFLKEIRSDGTYDDMIERYVNKGNYNMPDIKSSNSNGELKVGVMSDSGFPFTGVLNGELVGFDIELAKRFAAYTGMKFTPLDIQFPSMIASAVTNKIDIIICCITVTEEREKQIDFSDPYYNSGTSAIVKKKFLTEQAEGKMSKVEDIDGKRVGVFSGTIHDKYVSTNYPNSKVLLYDNTADMMLSLKTGKIDAIMIATSTADLLLKHNDDLAILNRELFPMPLGVGFRKESGELRKHFNEFLSTIRKNGTYDEMSKRWFINDAEEAVQPKFNNPVSDKKLTVAVSIEDLPYVAYMNGEYVGFDIEMIQKFAEWGNYNLKIIEIDFPGLINALVARKVDMITDGMAISEERQKQIDFSDAYSNLNSAVVIRKSDMAGFISEKEQPVRKSFFKSVSESFHNNIILEKRYLLILNGLKVTIIISVLAALFGTVIGGLICWMRMAKNKFLSYTASLLINLVRGTPVLVLLMIIFYVIFASVNINPVIVAVIAFGINFGAYVSEMFRTSIEGVDRGQQEAGIASGFTKVQTFINIIMPQALRQVLPVYKGEFISLLKATSIVGYIAVQDLTKASDIIRSRTFDAFFPLIMAAVLYIFIAWLLTMILDRIEISVDPKRKRQKRLEEVNL